MQHSSNHKHIQEIEPCTPTARKIEKETNTMERRRRETAATSGRRGRGHDRQQRRLEDRPKALLQPSGKRTIKKSRNTVKVLKKREDKNKDSTHTIELGVAGIVRWYYLNEHDELTQNSKKTSEKRKKNINFKAFRKRKIEDHRKFNTLDKYRNLAKYRNQSNRRRKFDSGIIVFIFIFSFFII